MYALKTDSNMPAMIEITLINNLLCYYTKNVRINGNLGLLGILYDCKIDDCYGWKQFKEKCIIIIEI